MSLPFATVAAEELNRLRALCQPGLPAFEEGNSAHCKDEILGLQWKLLQKLMSFHVAVKLFKMLIEISSGMDSPLSTGVISLM